jgi:hypothetical protein
MRTRWHKSKHWMATAACWMAVAAVYVGVISPDKWAW